MACPRCKIGEVVKRVDPGNDLPYYIMDCGTLVDVVQRIIRVGPKCMENKPAQQKPKPKPRRQYRDRGVWWRD